MTENRKTGSCLCGAVRYEVNGPLKQVVACHCTMCRKQSGHHYATADAWNEHFALTEERGLKWYRSSETCRRGFCAECGSVLFFEADGEDKISIAAGTIDGTTGLHIAAHIYTDDKGDYYDISGDAPQLAQGGHSVPMPAKD